MRIFLLILFVNLMNFAFAADDALIVTDFLNVRDAPSINGRIIEKNKFGDIIQIFGEKGSGIMNNGIFDLWYKISMYDEKWVNAFYVRKFPFFIAADTLVSRTDNGEHIIYTSPVIVQIKNIEIKNRIPYLNMYTYNLEVGSYFYDRNPRIEKISETYHFYDEEVRLIDNQFNHVVELYNDIVEKRYGLNPSVAWMWYHYEALEYDLSATELKYGIRAGVDIGYVTGILGDFYFRNWEYDMPVYVYSQIMLGNDEYRNFKIKFFIQDNTIIKISYEDPVIK